MEHRRNPHINNIRGEEELILFNDDFLDDFEPVVEEAAREERPADAGRPRRVILNYGAAEYAQPTGLARLLGYPRAEDNARKAVDDRLAADSEQCRAVMQKSNSPGK